MADLYYVVTRQWTVCCNGPIWTHLTNQVNCGELQIAMSLQDILTESTAEYVELDKLTATDIHLELISMQIVWKWKHQQCQPQAPLFMPTLSLTHSWNLTQDSTLLPKEQSLLYQLQTSAFITKSWLNTMYLELHQPTCNRCLTTEIETKHHHFEACSYVHPFWIKFCELLWERSENTSMDII